MRKSVTLIEIIVSAVILSAAFTLLLSAFMFTRRYTARANRRLVANNLIRTTSNYLYKEMSRSGVDAEAFNTTYDHPCPFADEVDNSVGNFTIDKVLYRCYYRVVQDGDNRNITFNVTYESIEF